MVVFRLATRIFNAYGGMKNVQCSSITVAFNISRFARITRNPLKIKFGTNVVESKSFDMGIFLKIIYDSLESYKKKRSRCYSRKTKSPKLKNTRDYFLYSFEANQRLHTH